MTTIKIDGARSAVNGATGVVNAAARAALTSVVREATAHYTNGPAIPPDEAHAQALARQADRWLAFAAERSRMTPRTVTAKALDSLAFSVLHGARSFAVPSKLTGTRAHQRRLWALVRDGYRPFERLTLDTATTDGIAVSLDDEPLGAVQTKHVPWARPLVPFGLTVHLAKVTGSERDGYTLGANVVLGGVGEALGRLLDALGGDGHSAEALGDGHSGDGQSGPVPVLAPVTPAVPCLPAETLPDALDVVLYRTVEGHACATLEHVVRHSPTGVEWGYTGSGPADLALSVLARVAGLDAADRHYQRFKAEVVAGLPFAGGVLRASDVRAWLATQDTPRPAA